jgi:cobaltochelatase CobN
VNPKWIAAMERHGYKGAFEMAATVDYLFGYDAMTDVASDWMYQQVAEKYLLDPDVAAFMDQANPWAARAIAEKLLEAGERGMWADPGDEMLGAIKSRYLALEDDLEGATV